MTYRLFLCPGGASRDHYGMCLVAATRGYGWRFATVVAHRLPQCIYAMYIQRSVFHLDLSEGASMVGPMTTTAPEQILSRYQRATEVITAEYHPLDHGMKYTVLIVGGKHHGTEIHCATEDSVRRMFDSVVAARNSNTEHPYLARV